MEGNARSPSTSEVVDPLRRRVLNERFTILEPIGSGGMGKVYKAIQSPLDRIVALKVLNPSFANNKDPGFRKRFFLEASLTSKLHHPNTITVIDYGHTPDGIYYIAMEYLEGQTLSQLLTKSGAIPWARCLVIAEQICRSLREAHRLHVIHRDLKPTNVMLLSNYPEADMVKVLDFGLVKSFVAKNDSAVDVERPAPELQPSGNGNPEIAQGGMFVGSPQYMAPEQSKNQADHRTDIYSLGALLYHMIAGRPPFWAKDSVEVILKHLHEQVPKISAIRPDLELPPEVEAIVMKCLEKDPAQRFPSMDAVLEAIRQPTISAASREPVLESAALLGGSDHPTPLPGQSPYLEALRAKSLQPNSAGVFASAQSPGVAAPRPSSQPPNSGVRRPASQPPISAARRPGSQPPNAAVPRASSQLPNSAVVGADSDHSAPGPGQSPDLETMDSASPAAIPPSEQTHLLADLVARLPMPPWLGQRPWVLAAPALLLVVILVFALWPRHRSPPTPAPPAVTQAIAPAGKPAPVEAPPAKPLVTSLPPEAPIAVPKSVKFVIASEPSGATLSHNGKVLGVTPITFDVSADAEGKAKAELKFTLKGYHPMIVITGGSNEIALTQRLQPYPSARAGSGSTASKAIEEEPIVTVVVPEAKKQPPVIALPPPAAEEPTLAVAEASLAPKPKVAKEAAATDNVPQGPIELDDRMTPPSKISGPDPEYTEKALDHEVEGVLSARCIVTAEGKVHGCRVIKGVPFMDRAVITALEQRRYSPALLRGKPVEIYYNIQTTLKLPR
jgi:serine/threonine-protein kinase